MRPRKNFDGEKFSSMLVLYDFDMAGKDRRVMCRCDCGVEKPVRLAKLKSGSTKSCGSCTFSPNYKHGLKDTAFYTCWENIIQRTKDNANPNYGGRGITVCDEWKKFKNFYDDMFPSYSDGLTIERVDVNGNYIKSNCVWETMVVQGHNRRKYRGNCKSYGVSYSERDSLYICSIVKNGVAMRYSGKSEEKCTKAYDDASELIYGDRPNGTVPVDDAIYHIVIGRLIEKGMLELQVAA